MSASMSMGQLGDLLKVALQQNSPFNSRGDRPTVKYIDPHIDLRNGQCFSVTFRGFGSENHFYVGNDQIKNPKSLYDRCITYLENGEIT